jgi:hypothetical protein
MRREVRKIAVKRLMRDEKGQALILTLLLLLVGSLIVTPVLNFIGTGVKSGQTYEQKDAEIYAADSGVEEALWHIRNDTLNVTLSSSGYDEYDYSTPYAYPYDLFLNGKTVTVNIQNIWIPKDMSTPSPSQAKQIIDAEKLIIVGYPSSTAYTYTIKIVFNWATTTERDNLRVKKIGIWLSPGFEYAGSCTLTGYSAQDISLYKGGQAVVWTFASPPLLKNVGVGRTDPLIERTFTFQYTSAEAGTIPELVSSWVDTQGVTGVTYSWDDSIRLYKIASVAGGVHIEAYGAKTKFRKLKSTISADYAVAGNTLLKATATTDPDKTARDRLYAESSSTLQRISLLSIPASGIVPAGKIPEEALIDKVYLYWSGWIDYHYYYYKSSPPSGWTWAEIPALRYNSNTKAQLIANSKVGNVSFAVGGTAQTVSASKYQIVNTADCSGAPQSWDYSCFKDVTDLVVSGNVTVREYIENAMKSAGSGTVTFVAGHADAVKGLHRPESSPAGAYANYYFNLYNIGQSTGYPLATPAHKLPGSSGTYDMRYQYAYAGWSLIIFYRSPALIQRQLYLYDDFREVSAGGSAENVTFSISGFLAPPVISANDTSHVSYFAGEGDKHYTGDSIYVNGQYLSDPPNNPWNNIFNSYSNALPDTGSDGQDVDTFVLPEGCILPYAASATVTLSTTVDPTYHLAEMYTLVYLIVSFRSEVTTGGIITNYSVRIG